MGPNDRQKGDSGYGISQNDDGSFWDNKTGGTIKNNDGVWWNNNDGSWSPGHTNGGGDDE